MSVPPPRWSRLDLAVFGLTAIGMVLAAVTSDREFLSFRRFMASLGPMYATPPAYEAPVSRAVQDFAAVVYAACPGLAFIAYRPGQRPRPRRRGPGHLALAIPVGFIAWGLLHWWWFFGGPGAWTGYDSWVTTGWPMTFWYGLPSGMGDPVARAILAGWLYLAVVGGWRGTEAPLERTGRWIGLAWILAAAAAWGIDLWIW